MRCYDGKMQVQPHCCPGSSSSSILGSSSSRILGSSSSSLILGSSSVGESVRRHNCACCESGYITGVGYLMDVSGISSSPFYPAGACEALNRVWVCDQDTCFGDCNFNAPPVFILNDGLFDYWGYARMAVNCNDPDNLQFIAEVAMFFQLPGFYVDNVPIQCGGNCPDIPAIRWKKNIVGLDCDQSGLALDLEAECTSCGTGATSCILSVIP